MGNPQMNTDRTRHAGQRDLDLVRGGTAFEQSLGPLGPGTYTVKGQFAVTGTATAYVDDWSFTVERIVL